MLRSLQLNLDYRDMSKTSRFIMEIEGDFAIDKSRYLCLSSISIEKNIFIDFRDNPIKNLIKREHIIYVIYPTMVKSPLLLTSCVP